MGEKSALAAGIALAWGVVGVALAIAILADVWDLIAEEYRRWRGRQAWLDYWRKKWSEEHNG